MERVLAYSSGLYFFMFLIQRNIPAKMTLMLVLTAVVIGMVVAPWGLIFRRKIQEFVANWNTVR